MVKRESNINSSTVTSERNALYRPLKLLFLWPLDKNLAIVGFTINFNV